MQWLDQVRPLLDKDKNTVLFVGAMSDLGLFLLAVLRAAYGRNFTDFQKDGEAAKALLAFGDFKNDTKLNPSELAAFTAVASIMLNLDEVVTKE